MEPMLGIAARRLPVSLAVVATVALSCAPAPDRSLPLPGDAEADYAAVELTATEPRTPEDTPAGSEHRAVVAEAAGLRVPVFRSPGADRPWTALRHGGPFDTAPVFLVQETRDDWLRALLPMEPNGSEGWIRARDVNLYQHGFRIEVDLGSRRLTAYRDQEVVMRETIAIGTPSTPTPTGRFFTTVLVKPDDPSGPYGPFAWGLSAYSEVLDTFAGGDGQVAIHGTNTPWAIGDAVSHGCVRVHNDVIRRLARLLPLGTPVRITA
jgi:lipoprotein-anchoring transpeptidase ErfK/SrfK